MTVVTAPPPPFPFTAEQDEPEFEVWTGTQFGRADPIAYLTLARDGRLGLNQSAVALLGNTERVELLFDRRRCLIGLRPCAKDVPHSYKLSGSGRKGQGIGVNAQRFCKAYNLLPDQTRRAALVRYGDVVAACFGPAPQDGAA